MKIGFRNFKRFNNFHPVSLAPITIMVGTNNSGKSTFIKALALLLENLNLTAWGVWEPPLKRFSFQETNTRYGWGDFASMRCRGAYSDTMVFEWSTEHFKFSVSFGAGGEEMVLSPDLYARPEVKEFTISGDDSATISYTYDSENRCWDVALSGIDRDELARWLNSRLEWFYLQERARKGEDAAVEYKDFSKYSDFIALEYYRKAPRSERETVEMERMLENLDRGEEIAEPVQLSGKSGKGDSNPVFVSILSDYAHRVILRASAEIKNDYAADMFYIEAHNASHDFILRADDKNNTLAQTVSEYYSQVDSRLMIPESGEKSIEIKGWVCKWLRNLNIVKYFEINREGQGTWFSVKVLGIHDSDSGVGSDAYSDLGTLGTGSIQIFILLLKIAVALSKWRADGRQILIAVEEPEQNLHPAMQSRLADLFLEVSAITGGNVRFIVETHSEYLIRRSQVIVAEDNDALEKFKVYYFPEDGQPYDMEYRTDGHFEEAFGEGFFDEAGKWYRALAINRQK